MINRIGVENQTFPVLTPLNSNPVYHFSALHLWRWNEQQVPKGRHRKLRRREITQKKQYDVQPRRKFEIKNQIRKKLKEEND